MPQELSFGHNIFGYTTLVREGDSFVALTGDGEQDLRLDMEVALLGDSRGYVPSGFSPGDKVTIVGFKEPFKNGGSDHIVKVGDKSRQGWVKPSNIQRNISAQRAATASDASFDRIVSVLVDGNEGQRAGVLRQIQTSPSINRPALAGRLRAEIRENFSPGMEKRFASAIRDPKKISSIRSWMFSSLIWADGEGEESRIIILDHISQNNEPDRIVRFWILASLYQSKSSYATEAAKLCLSDTAPEIAALAQAIAFPTDHSIIGEFRSSLITDDFEKAWPILRLLRIVPILELTGEICRQFVSSAAGSPLAYDTLYALTNPVLAREAVKTLSEHLGVDGVVKRVIAEARGTDSNAARNFALLLSAFDSAGVDRALEAARQNPETGGVAALLREYTAEFRRGEAGPELFVAGYASDTIDIRNDLLDIQEDVQTLAAVMMAKEVKPPLAIGLFGDWGSGKSYFMNSMKAATIKLAERAESSPNSQFCSNIVSIDFNAWHYIDANLWASLVSHILERLAAYVAPQLTAEEREAALMSELGSAKAVVNEAEAEKKRAQKLIDDRQNELQKLQVERQQKEVQLRDLRLSDLQTLLSGQEELKQELNQSLEQIGVPAALNSVSDLSRVASEAYTVRGRIAMLFIALLKGNNRGLLVTLLLVMLVGIPLIARVLHDYVISNDLIVRASALVSQLIVLVTGATAVLRRAVDVAKTNLAKIENAKQQVDKLIAEKRQNPTKEEIDIQNQIASLKAQEQETASRLTAAATRVLELEERIRALKEGRSLARFLVERLHSEDYRKHLGLISTIRQDFESLGERITIARSAQSNSFRHVDRIILYIDDLDRCPADKVMEVLQAVHLLLAYPLFVVVVGVDPRWLLHTVGTTYPAFKKNGKGLDVNPDLWRTTPQNYLEKIFQIPFTLRPMTSPGYSKLMKGLLSPGAKSESQNRLIQPPLPPPQPDPDSDSPLPPVIPPDPDQDIEVIGSSEIVIHEESLVIKPWEAAYAEGLFALIPTPRAAKRFSNIYRILKAPIRPEGLLQFEGTAEAPGDFQAPMLLLAILISAPMEGAIIFPKLLELASKGRDVVEALQHLETLGLTSKNLGELGEKIRPIISGSGFPRIPDIYLEWIPRVARFSFEVGRAVRMIAAA